MADKTAIEWTDATWNPTRICSRVSEGCRNCYAERIAARFSDEGQPYHGLAVRILNYGVSAPITPRWTGEVRFVESALDFPLRWKKPRRIFVNSMSDLFHEKVPDESVDRIFAVMYLSPTHIFQVLTKRPARMLAYMRAAGDRVWLAAEKLAGHLLGCEIEDEAEPIRDRFWSWPFKNVWIGVSVENQATADERIPLLLETPAAVREFPE